jgi:hypothetical protein
MSMTDERIDLATVHLAARQSFDVFLADSDCSVRILQCLLEECLPDCLAGVVTKIRVVDG